MKWVSLETSKILKATLTVGQKLPLKPNEWYHVVSVLSLTWTVLMWKHAATNPEGASTLSIFSFSSCDWCSAGLCYPPEGYPTSCFVVKKIPCSPLWFEPPSVSSRAIFKWFAVKFLSERCFNQYVKFTYLSITLQKLDLKSWLLYLKDCGLSFHSCSRWYLLPADFWHQMKGHKKPLWLTKEWAVWLSYTGA